MHKFCESQRIEAEKKQEKTQTILTKKKRIVQINKLIQMNKIIMVSLTLFRFRVYINSFSVSIYY